MGLELLGPNDDSQTLLAGDDLRQRPMYVPADATDEQMSALHQQMQETLERCRLGAEKQLADGNRTEQ